MSITTESQVSEASQASEDYPLSPVPLTARKPIWSLAPLLMGFALTSTTLFAGGTIGPAFNFPMLLGIIVVGNILLGSYCAALGYIAYKSGLSTVLMARFSFGNFGSRWVDFILGFTQIGWYAVTNAVISEAIVNSLNLPERFYWIGIIFFTYFFCITAYIGYTAMDWLSRVAVPAMLILLAISLFLGFQDAGNLLAIAPTKPMPLNAALAVVIGTFISGGTQATNWSRYADTSTNAIWSTLVSFAGVNGLLIFTGAFCTLVYGGEDIVAAMGKQGILIAGLILLILNVWTTQDNTIYAFSIAGTNFFRTRKRHMFVLGGATFALILALTGIYEGLINYLIFLGVAIPPVGGIIMTDFWLHHKGEFPSLEMRLPAFNLAGVIAYVVAAATAYLTGNAGIGVGPINGVVVAAVLYGILVKVLPPSQITPAE